MYWLECTVEYSPLNGQSVYVRIRQNTPSLRSCLRKYKTSFDRVLDLITIGSFTEAVESFGMSNASSAPLKCSTGHGFNAQQPLYTSSIVQNQSLKHGTGVLP